MTQLMPGAAALAALLFIVAAGVPLISGAGTAHPISLVAPMMA